MEFIIKKEILLNNLNHVAKAISSKNLIPVLSGVNFILTNEGLTLIACDNEVMITSFIDKKEINEIKNTGSIVISGKYIVEYIRKITADLIHIALIDNTKVLLKTNSSELTLNGLDSNDFPVWNIDQNETELTLKPKEFKEIINQTLFG